MYIETTKPVIKFLHHPHASYKQCLVNEVLSLILVYRTVT